MIRSQRELKRKKQTLAGLEQAIARVGIQPGDVVAVARRRAYELLVRRRDDLAADIAAYERLRAEGPAALRIEQLADLPAGLIQGRIASGLSQAALAARLGVAPQQIQHWESELYSHATFASVLEVATALGLAGMIRLARRGRAAEPGPRRRAAAERARSIAGDAEGRSGAPGE